MICMHCIHYNGRFIECDKDIEVTDGLEATYCDDYLYNGGVSE